MVLTAVFIAAATGDRADYARRRVVRSDTIQRRIFNLLILAPGRGAGSNWTKVQYTCFPPPSMFILNTLAGLGAVFRHTFVTGQ
jgi:hypothetical protein